MMKQPEIDQANTDARAQASGISENSKNGQNSFLIEKSNILSDVNFNYLPQGIKSNKKI